MLNQVALAGRLTADPKLKMTNSGVSVTSFTIAVDRNYQSNGERGADFIQIVAWRGTAEFICRNFRKGKMIILQGEIHVRDYTAQDGSKRYVTEVTANNVFFAGDKKEQATEDVYGGYATTNPGQLTELNTPDDELPF